MYQCIYILYLFIFHKFLPAFPPLRIRTYNGVGAVLCCAVLCRIWFVSCCLLHVPNPRRTIFYSRYFCTFCCSCFSCRRINHFRFVSTFFVCLSVFVHNMYFLSLILSVESTYQCIYTSINIFFHTFLPAFSRLHICIHIYIYLFLGGS